MNIRPGGNRYEQHELYTHRLQRAFHRPAGRSVCVPPHKSRWYFTASVPEYDRITLRAADSLEGLREAGETVVWRAHEDGAMSQRVWAPELHFLD